MTGTRRAVAALFLLPALVLLGALVVYPIGYSVCRSFFDAVRRRASSASTTTGRCSPTTASAPRSRTTRSGWWSRRPRHRARPDLRGAHRTGPLGHRVQAGRLHADGDLDARRGHHLPAGLRAGPGHRASPTRSWWACTTPSPSRSAYPGARPRPATPLQAGAAAARHHQGTGARRAPRCALPLVGVPPTKMPRRREARRGRRSPRGGTVTGTAWLDFTRGGGGTPGVIDPGEQGAARDARSRR